MIETTKMKGHENEHTVWEEMKSVEKNFSMRQDQYPIDELIKLYIHTRYIYFCLLDNIEVWPMEEDVESLLELIEPLLQ